MQPHTFRRTVDFEYQGFKVRVTVLAYCQIDDEFMQGCFADWVRSRKRKKMTCDMKITFPTLYGA
jgi:hypothetical protein